LREGLLGTAAMADDRHALDAEQRRAAVARVVEDAPDARHRVTAGDLAAELLVHELVEELRDRLIELEEDVADKAVADHHVEVAVRTTAAQDVAPLDVAGEVEPALHQQLVRLFHRDVALLGLLADGEQPDGGVLLAVGITGVLEAEPREADEL